MVGDVSGVGDWIGVGEGLIVAFDGIEVPAGMVGVGEISPPVEEVIGHGPSHGSPWVVPGPKEIVGDETGPPVGEPVGEGEGPMLGEGPIEGEGDASGALHCKCPSSLNT